nr:restriction endonuclease subunit S [Clostridium paraputrificum]
MKEGYKKTDLGWIPKEWELKTIGELFDFKNGLNKEKEYFGKGTKIVNYVDVYKNRYIDNSNINGFVTVTEKEKDSFNTRKGDVFFTRTSETINEIGMTAVLGEDIKDLVYSGFVLRARPKTDELSLGYKKYCFSDFYARKEIIRKSSYTTRALTSGTLLKDVLIKVPPLKEQEKIADILSTVDSQVDDTDKLIEKTKELKKGLMQRLLTKGIGHTEFKETEVGEIPMEWEMKSLGKIFKLSSGEFLSQKNIIDGPYPVYGGNGITGYHNEFKHKDSKIVIGRVGAKCGCVCRSIKESWITDNALYINEKLCEFDDEFMLYLLYYLDLNKFANQNAQPVISGQKIYVINIALPNLEEQKKIANILSSVDMQIEKYENKKIKLEELKKGLMQQLLTGKIRVKV